MALILTYYKHREQFVPKERHDRSILSMPGAHLRQSMLLGVGGWTLCTFDLAVSTAP